MSRKKTVDSWNFWFSDAAGEHCVVLSFYNVSEVPFRNLDDPVYIIVFKNI